MRGRKPQHVRIERDAIMDMAPPDWLPVDARAEWERIVPILTERRILTDADIGTLENYCLAMGQVREMQKEIARLGAVQLIYKVDKDGTARVINSRKNPAVAVQADAMTRARLLAAELGATPVSRSRPAIEDNDGDEDLFAWGGA